MYLPTGLFDSKCQLDLLTLIEIQFDESSLVRASHLLTKTNYIGIFVMFLFCYLYLSMIIEMNCYNGFLSITCILNLKIRPTTSQILKKLLLKHLKSLTDSNNFNNAKHTQLFAKLWYTNGIQFELFLMVLQVGI